jgi:hypothetical protein
MSTESSQKDIGIPSTAIPTIVNDTPLTHSTTMVVVSKVPIITLVCPVLNSQPIATNPFGSLCHSSGYNIEYIPMASSHFSFGMPNFTSQFSSSILAYNPNTSIGLGCMATSHTPFSFGFLPFHLGSNPSPNDPRWSGQPGRPVDAYSPSFKYTSSASILTNTFSMMNPPLSSGFTPRGG